VCLFLKQNRYHAPDGSGLESDYGHQPAGMFSLSTVREESVRIAAGTEPEIVYMVSIHARFAKLRSDDSGQIEKVCAVLWSRL
jgi:hypothetical protein